MAGTGVSALRVPTHPVLADDLGRSCSGHRDGARGAGPSHLAHLLGHDPAPSARPAAPARASPAHAHAARPPGAPAPAEPASAGPRDRAARRPASPRGELCARPRVPAYLPAATSFSRNVSTVVSRSFILEMAGPGGADSADGRSGALSAQPPPASALLASAMLESNRQI